MKKSTIFLLVILVLLILILVYFRIVGLQEETKNNLQFNSEFEEFLDKEVYGTNVVTVINKAIDYNEKNNISKDEKGYYIEDEEKSILVELQFINSKDKITTYKMEQIASLGIEKFLSSEFNLVNFRCTSKEYHKNGRLSKLIFTQLEK